MRAQVFAARCSMPCKNLASNLAQNGLPSLSRGAVVTSTSLPSSSSVRSMTRLTTATTATSSSSSSLLRQLHNNKTTSATTPQTLQYNNINNSSNIFTQRRSLTIESSSTPNPECLRFFSMELSFLPPGHSMEFPNDGHGYKSPLAEALFSFPGVAALYFSDEFITVTKDTNFSWDTLQESVKEAVICFAESDKSIIAPDCEDDVRKGNEDTDPVEGDSEVILAVKELLNTRVRPMLQGDGGDMKYVGMDAEGIIYIVLRGACKSCPSSGVTLKHGIERMLMHWIPEVQEVEEVDEDFAADWARQEAEEKKREQEQQQKEQKEAGGEKEQK